MEQQSETMPYSSLNWPARPAGSAAVAPTACAVPSAHTSAPASPAAGPSAAATVAAQLASVPARAPGISRRRICVISASLRAALDLAADGCDIAAAGTAAAVLALGLPATTAWRGDKAALGEALDPTTAVMAVVPPSVRL